MNQKQNNTRALLIFDLDGTLFHDGRATITAVREVCETHGIVPPSAEEINSWFGRPVHEFHDWFRGMAPKRDMSAFLAELDRREYELVAVQGKLFPGVAEMLEHLGREHTLAICSNGSKVYIDIVLESRGIGRHFELVRHREIEEENKTSMVAEILERLPARPAVVVGDRNDDITAARENGLLSIGTAYGFGAPGEVGDADTIVREAAQIPGAVEELIRPQH